MKRVVRRSKRAARRGGVRDVGAEAPGACGAVAMNQSKRLVVNTACSVAGLFLPRFATFLLTPFILGKLGEDVYGIWQLTGSLLAYSYFLSLGLNSAISRWVPMYLVSKDTEGINRVVNTTLVAYAIGAVVVVLGCIVLALGFPYWFHIRPEYQTASRLAVLITGAGFLFIVTDVFTAVLTGMQRYELTTMSDAIGETARITGIIALLKAGFGLVAVTAAWASAVGIRSLLKAVLALRKCPGLRIRPSLARWSAFREMFGYSVNTMIYSSGQVIQRQAPLVVIGWFYAKSLVTMYSLPLMLISVIVELAIIGASPIKPAATHLDAESRGGHVQTLLLWGTKYELLFVIPMFAFLLGYGDAIFHAWLRDKYVDGAAALLPILAVGCFCRLLHTPSYYVVIGLGKHRVFGAATLAMAIVSVVAAIVLTGPMRLGVRGVAYGFAVSEAMFSLCFLMPYCCVTVGVSFVRIMRESVLPAVLGAFPMLVSLAAAKTYYEPRRLRELLLVMAVLAVPAVAGIWFVGLRRDERERFLKMVPLSRDRGPAAISPDEARSKL